MATDVPVCRRERKMIWGIIAVVICILLLLKLLSRKKRWQKLDELLCRLHKPLGSIVLVVAVIHAFITFDVWATRAVLVYGSGIFAAVMLFLMAGGYVFRNKQKHLWVKMHRRGAAITLILILLHISSYYLDFFAYKTNISEISLSGIEVSSIKDGTYEGAYDAGYIYAKVQVRVRDGRIKDIKIVEHRNERGARAEQITNDIIERQKTNVDAVSGATNSSRVIEKAVENALS